MKEKINAFFIVWGVVLVVNQIFIFHGCFSPSCLLAALPHTGIIAFFLVRAGNKNNEQPANKPDLSRTEKPPISEKIVIQPLPIKKVVIETENKPAEPDFFKQKGDKYENFIGKKFEEKGDLVIYNGFINGYADQGVDIICISTATKTIHLIQCKNWTTMRMTLAHLQAVYQKLEDYNFDCFNLSVEAINNHQTAYKDNVRLTLVNTQHNLAKFTVRKTLYLASEKVVDLEIGRYLTMMSPTIFKYKDMKIVMKAEQR
jgi:hypothetical protein